MSYALKANLRGQTATPELQRLLPKNELKLAADSSHLPNLVSLVGEAVLQQAHSISLSMAFLQASTPFKLRRGTE